MIMNFTSIDFETANPSHVSICAAGMAVFEDGELTESPYWLVRPPKVHGWFHDVFIECRGLTHLDVQDAPEFPAIAPEFVKRLTCADIVIAHNAAFDISHLRQTLDHFGLPCPNFDYVCTCTLARRVWPDLHSVQSEYFVVKRNSFPCYDWNPPLNILRFLLSIIPYLVKSASRRVQPAN